MRVFSFATHCMGARYLQMTRRRQRATCLFRANVISRVIRASTQASSFTALVIRLRALPRSIGHGTLGLVDGDGAGGGRARSKRRAAQCGPVCSIHTYNITYLHQTRILIWLWFHADWSLGPFQESAQEVQCATTWGRNF